MVRDRTVRRSFWRARRVKGPVRSRRRWHRIRAIVYDRPASAAPVARAPASRTLRSLSPGHSSAQGRRGWPAAPQAPCGRPEGHRTGCGGKRPSSGPAAGIGAQDAGSGRSARSQFRRGDAGRQSRRRPPAPARPDPSAGGRRLAVGLRQDRIRNQAGAWPGREASVAGFHCALRHLVRPPGRLFCAGMRSMPHRSGTGLASSAAAMLARSVAPPASRWALAPQSRMPCRAIAAIAERRWLVLEGQ